MIQSTVRIGGLDRYAGTGEIRLISYLAVTTGV